MSISDAIELSKLAFKTNTPPKPENREEVLGLASHILEKFNKLEIRDQVKGSSFPLMILTVAHQNLGEFKTAGDLAKRFLMNARVATQGELMNAAAILHTGAFCRAVQAHIDRNNSKELLHDASDMIAQATELSIDANAPDKRIAAIYGTAAFIIYSNGKLFGSPESTAYIAEAENHLMQAHTLNESQLTLELSESWPGNASKIIGPEWDEFVLETEAALNNRRHRKM